MKRLLFIVVINCLFTLAIADNASYGIKFRECDFQIKLEQGDSLSIISLNSPATYGAVGDPAIPVVAKRIVLTEGENVIGISSSFKKRLLKSNVDLANVQRIVPTNVATNETPVVNSQYLRKIYPESNCVIAGANMMGKSRIVDLMVCPYVYDATTRELFFFDSLIVDLEITPIASSRSSSEIHPNEIELITASAYNAEDLNFDKSLVLPSVNGGIEYLVITNEALKDAFQPLVNWKQKKE